MIYKLSLLMNYNKSSWCLLTLALSVMVVVFVLSHSAFSILSILRIGLVVIGSESDS